MSVLDVHRCWDIRVGGISITRPGRPRGAFIIDKETADFLDDLSLNVDAHFVRITFLDRAGEKIREIDATLI